MHNAPQKSEFLCRVVAILADILFGDPGIVCKESLNVRRPRVNIRRVPQLWRLDSNGHREFQDILPAEQAQPPRLPAEVPVEEGIAVWAPVDLSHIEVAGDVEVPTEASQFLPFNRFPVDGRPGFVTEKVN